MSENGSGPPQPATREREVRALTDAMRGLGLDHGLILTEGNGAPIIADGLTMEVRSLVEAGAEEEKRLCSRRERNLNLRLYLDDFVNSLELRRT